MLILVVCWLLFALPMLTMLAMMVGARLYHLGQSGQAPTLSLPRFSFGRSKPNGQPEREKDRLPLV